MADEAKYLVTFTNGALAKLEELAVHFGLSKEDILIKGIKLVEISRTNSLCKEDADGKKYLIDVKKI